MATNVLVSDILEEIRVRLNEPTVSSTTFWSSTVALNMLKYSARRLSGIIRRTNSDYFTVNSTITTQAGVNVVSLPSDCTDVRQIAWMRSETDSVPLQLATVDDWLEPSENVEAWSGAPLYRVMGNTVMLFPTPNAAYDLSIYYDTGIFVDETTDLIATQPGWEEWMVLDVCIRARQREEKDARDFMAERAKVEAEIVTQSSKRDRFRQHVIRDLWDGGDWVDSRSLYVRR